MRPITLALLIVAGLLVTIAASWAQPAPRQAVTPANLLGPWQMLATGTGAAGYPGVFLLNSNTGALFICVLTPANQGPITGCGPMPNSP